MEYVVWWFAVVVVERRGEEIRYYSVESEKWQGCGLAGGGGVIFFLGQGNAVPKEGGQGGELVAPLPG